MMTENKNGAVGRAKRSLARSQIRAIVILLAAAILLGAVAAVVLYIVRQDIDTYTEVLTYASDGNDTYISYYSRRDGDGFAVFDEDGNALAPFNYEDKTCYETLAGTILTLDENGMFSVIAVLDNGDGETVNSSNTALLLYQRLERAEIQSIETVNDKGGYSIYSVSEDTDGDGKKEQSFFIKGYESSPIHPVTLSAIVTRFGMLSLNVKLDRDKMLAEDEKHKDDGGYIPIINPDGSVNLSIYGLTETYEEIDEKTEKPVTKTTPYFILSDIYGNIHKVYVGNETTDGQHYYVRYENIASAVLDSATATAEEKEAERKKLDSISKNVYLLTKDPSASSGYSSSVERIVLSSAAEISAPTIILTYGTNNYYDVRDFTIRKKNGDDYKKVISFTYDPIELRMNTIRQDLVYHIVDPEGLGLVGYEMDTDRTFAALFALTDISAAGSDTTSSTMNQENTAVNYVKTVALITDKVNDLSKVTEDMIKNDPEVRDAMLALSEYGLLEAEYILSFDMPLNINNADSEVISQAVLISKRTDDNTYYVWSPMFSQVVEIGAQYLNFVEYDSFDWVDRDLFHTMITFSEGMHITAGDLDVLFRIYEKLTVTSSPSFSAASKGFFDVSVTVDENGKRKLAVSANIPYTLQYTDGTTEEETYKADLVSLNIATVENYCRRLLGEDLTGLTAEELAAIERYAATVGGLNVAHGVVTLTHTVSIAGDQYGYVKPTSFLLTFTYEGGNLAMTAREAGKVTSRLIYDAKVFSDYYAYYLNDGGVRPELTESELAAVNEYFLTVDRVKSEQTRVTVSVAGGEPFDMDVDEFKDLYLDLLVISFYGRADESDSVGGKVLTEEEMAALAAGNDHSMEIRFFTTVGDDLVYRSYDYSATKSYTVINGQGKFYINKMTKDAFITSVAEIAKSK